MISIKKKMSPAARRYMIRFFPAMIAYVDAFYLTGLLCLACVPLLLLVRSAKRQAAEKAEPAHAVME